MIGFDLGAEPSWQACKLCGTETMRETCFSCCQKADRESEVRDEAAIAGIPARFSWATVDAAALAHRVQSTKSIEALVKAILEAPRVTVGGATGSGKTSLLVACLRKVLPYGFMVRAERLARAPIEHSAGQGEAPLVLRAKAARVLLLDDLGTDEITKVSAVRDVVFARYDAGLPTWISTGISSSEIESLYGSGFARRAVSEALTIGLGVKS